MANRAKRKEEASPIAVLEPEQEPETENPQSRIASLLPELPDYLERSIFNLQPDDNKHPRAHNLSAEEKQTFVRIYVDTGSIDEACKAVDISVPTFYSRMQTDPDFERSMTLAKLSMGDRIQSTSYKRALEPNGVVDRMCQLKRFFPRIYRESPGVTIMSTTINAGGLR